MVETLKIHQLRRDGGTQSRAALDDSTVEDYRQLVEEADLEKPDGVEYVYPFKDPIDVICDGENHWLHNGFHRTQALEEYYGDDADILANVTQGTLAAAQWESFGANKDHGLRRSNADKRQSVIGALKHKFDDVTFGYQWTDRKLAKHTGVDHKTVGSIRHELEDAGEIPQSTTRTDDSGRTIDTAHIGGNGNGAANAVASISTPAVQPLLNEDGSISLKDWKSKIYQPWVATVRAEAIERMPQADMLTDDERAALLKNLPVLIEYKGHYLLIEPPDAVMNRYGLSQTGANPEDDYHYSYAYVCKVDGGYRQLLERDEDAVTVSFDDLPDAMQALVKGYGKARRITLNEWKRLGFDVQPGDFVVVDEVIGQVVHVHDSYLRLMLYGSERSVRNQIVKPASVLQVQKPGYHTIWRLEQLKRAAWQEQYQLIKRYFAADAVLIVECGSWAAAFGDDAKLAVNAVRADVVKSIRIDEPEPVFMISASSYEEPACHFLPAACVVHYMTKDPVLLELLNGIAAAQLGDALANIDGLQTTLDAIRDVEKAVKTLSPDLRDHLQQNVDAMRNFIMGDSAAQYVALDSEGSEDEDDEDEFIDEDDELEGEGVS